MESDDGVEDTARLEHDRGATEPDVRKALVTATAAIHQTDRDNWRVEAAWTRTAMT